MQGKPAQSWIVDSKLWIPDSKYWIPIFDIGTWESGFQSLMGFRIRPHYSGFHKQKFPEFWNSLYGAIRVHRRALKKGGAIFSGAYNGTKTTFQNKLHISVDQNTS